MTTKFQPVYIVGIQAGDCRYDVRVNDCPVISVTKEVMIATQIPVNQWILYGDNTLEVTMIRRSDVRGRCQLQVWRQDLADIQAYSYLTGFSTVCRIKDREEALVTYRHQIHFETDAPFPTWRWHQSKSEPHIPKTIILDQVQTFWQALSSQDMGKLRHYYREKNEELSISRYQTPEQREEEMVSQFLEIWAEGKWHLQMLNLDNIQLLPYASNRLFKVVTTDRLESPICYVDTQSTVAIYLELVFYRNTNGEWHIIR